MRTEKQDTRRREIEAAAYEVLAEKGYKATTMLSIAKHASASNETLYKWYGNKQSLIQSLVEENGNDARGLLHRSLQVDASPADTLRTLGPVLLRLVTGHKSVVLNRAAAGDVYDTGTLGSTIEAAGKTTIVPLVSKVFLAARDKGMLTFDDAAEVADIYLSLLIGDIQIKRVIGVRMPLHDDEIEHRARRAVDIVFKLFGSQGESR